MAFRLLGVYTRLPPVGPSERNIFSQMVPLAPNRLFPGPGSLSPRLPEPAFSDNSAMLFCQLSLMGQREMGKVAEDPVIFQGVVHNRQQLSGGGHDGFAGSAPALNAFIKPAQGSE